MVAGFFRFYFFTGSHSQHMIKKLFAQSRQIGSFNHSATVKIDPVRFLIRKRCITGNLNRRHRRSKGGSSSCSEQYDMGTGSGKGCRSDQIVSGSA